MPFTLSHAVAVLPLRRYCPRYFNLAGLIIGSMTPDAGYYLGRFDLATVAHSPLGTVTVCLPVGLALLGLFYLVRQPACFLLPSPHRQVLQPLAAQTPAVQSRTVMSMVVSILLGAWTHLVWDSFTHRGGWFVQRLDWLGEPALLLGDTGLSGYWLLQQASTFVGMIVLLGAYLFWLHQRHAPDSVERSSDRWRYALWVGLIFLPLAVAVPTAYQFAAAFEGFVAFRVFLFRTGVYSVAMFVPLLVLSAVIVQGFRRHHG
jgi:hypothetical protein